MQLWPSLNASARARTLSHRKSLSHLESNELRLAWHLELRCRLWRAHCDAIVCEATVAVGHGHGRGQG